MIHEACMPVYRGVQIFIAYVRTGSPEVVQEALADLKSTLPPEVPVVTNMILVNSAMCLHHFYINIH